MLQQARNRGADELRRQASGPNRAEYAGRPVLLTQDEVRRGMCFHEEGGVTLTRASGDVLAIPEADVFDLMLPTMFGLLDDLTPGSPLMDEFLVEWEKVQDLIVDPDSEAARQYGQWVLYPRQRHLVRYAPSKWHRLGTVVRNSTLLSVAGKPHDWGAARDVLDRAVLAVAGCSVGSNILHSATMLIRPAHVKAADCKEYQLNNANRVRVGYADFSRNKAVVCAEQVHAADPFLGVSVYEDGIDARSVEDFVLGTETEPPATIIVEETDDPDTKLMLREAARRARVPLVTVADLGTAATVDIRRFDVDPTLPLAPFVDDQKLFELRAAFERDAGDRGRFIEFAYAISGKEEALSVPEFRDVLLQNVEVHFAGMPQLGSTAAIAGGMAASSIARILLGQAVPERCYYDVATGTSRRAGREM